MNEIIDRLADRILAAAKQPGAVFLYPHVGIDGDALCSSLALMIALRRIGVRVRLLLDEKVPDRLSFLPSLELIETYSEDQLTILAADQQLAMAIDCSDAERTGHRHKLFSLAPEVAVIDHHIARGPITGLRWTDTSAAATGEMVFDLISLLEKRLEQKLLDTDIETLLMTALISDTGGFVYSNTSSRTFQTAACLMEGEINLRQITYQLFDLTSQERMRLMGRVFTDARFMCGGRLALATADQKLLEEYGATDADLEGIIAHLRNVGGVEVAFMIRELRPGYLRVNIRSSDHFNASDFAHLYGGGGHAKAAGLQLKDITLEQAVTLIADKAGEWLSADH